MCRRFMKPLFYCLFFITLNMRIRQNIDDIVSKINKDFGDLFYHGTNGVKSKACILCNRHLRCNKIQWVEKETITRRKKKLGPLVPISPEIKESCTYSGPGSSDLKNLMLSPNGFYDSTTKSFACCPDCSSSFVVNNERPTFSLCNNYVFGLPPDELLCLNELEIAIISRSRISGHIFTYHGGSHQCMKGMHSVYDVNVAHLEHSLNYMEHLDFPRVIACVMSGPFTGRQKQFVLKKMSIDRHKVKKALQWLRVNNEYYKNITDEEINSFPEPIVIDKTSHCESEDNNVEMLESFDFAFPDASCTENNGGFDNVDQMKEILLELKSKGHEFTLSSYSTNNLLREFDSHTFEKCFPLQFPYGRGGRHDVHYNKSGKPEISEFQKYIEYLIDLAVPSFQMPNFLLVACNGFFRERILKRSCWSVTAKNYNDVFVSNVANLDPKVLTRSINNMINGVSSGTNSGTELLRSLKTVCRALPHTNEAAKDARSKIYSMTQRFGQPAIFFTVSPDDLNNLRVQIYGNENKSVFLDENEIDGLSEECLKAKYKDRVEFRVSNPGLCCHDFENIVELVEEHIIGWNKKEGRAHCNGGLFGIAEAFCGAVEEQGRKSLHIHYAIFLKGWNELLKQLFSANEEEKEVIKHEISEWLDSIASTYLLGGRLKEICPDGTRKCLDIVNDNVLRKLRHKEGCRKIKGIFVECDSASENLSCESLATKFLSQKNDYPFPIEVEQSSVSKAMLMKMNMMVPIFDINHNADIVNAFENVHASYHRKACFKWDCECRHNFPQCPNRKTYIDSYTKSNWYSWKGQKSEIDIYESRIKREKFDLYVNVYCPAVSQSCLACNSNISAIFNGRVPIYMTNYITKGTQEDDSESYKRLIENVKRRFTKQIHDVDYSETLSRLMSCIFAHTRAHIISAPLAKYLIRNKSRFRFSHEFEHVPIECINRILTNQPFHIQILQTPKKSFFVSKALDYLYRPKELEKICMYEFFSCYESVAREPKKKTKKKKKKPGNPIYKFKKEHPQYKERGVRKHDRDHILKFSSWAWPDTKTFSGNIMRKNNVSNFKELEAMDKFSRWSMILFYPFRKHCDLKRNDTYLSAFKHAINNNLLYKDFESILTNIQDVRNNIAIDPPEEALKQRTEEYVTAEYKPESDENEETLAEELDDLYNYFQETDFDEMDEFEKNLCDEENISLETLRKQGYHNCGLSNVSKWSMTAEDNDNSKFIKYEEEEIESEKNKKSTKKKNIRHFTTPKTLLSVLSQRKKRRVETTKENRNSFPIANGSVTSMLDWSKAAKLDRKQRQAFLTLVSTFVLTYYEDAKSDCDPTQLHTANSNRPKTLRHELSTQMKLLEKINGRKRLILFLTGAGGTGKSKVIKEVLLYCEEYCDQIKVPFTDRTIVVTALTGVAAVLIHGETLHSATHVYNKDINSDMIERWHDARLVIVDEISFANKDLLETVDSRLRELRENIYEKFGGVNIAFMGDFRQLEPIRNEPLYRDASCAIWSTINCFIELETNHRAKEDLPYAELLKRFRDGEPSKNDIDTINSRVVLESDPIPDNIQYASPTNKDRCSINNAIFLKHLEATHSNNSDENIPSHTILIGAGNIYQGMKKKRNLKPFRLYKILYEQCSEADCTKSNNSRIDPLLKLFLGCPIMLIMNNDVKDGEANGCSCFVKEIVLKGGTVMSKKCVDGYWVNFVTADQVAYITVSPEQNPKKIFVLTPHKHSMLVKFPKPSSLSMDKKDRLTVRMSMLQFCMNLNHATTGHKLQGKSLDRLFVSSWSYTRNWPYVLLSRVRSLEGLYLRQKLSYQGGRGGKDYTVPLELRNMLAKFRATKTPTTFDDLDEDELRQECKDVQDSFER